MELLTTFISTYLLIFAAEFGDKSQLVCLVSAARHGGRSVLVGASLAFILLTMLAVVVGGTLGSLIPTAPLQLVVAALFIFFGVQLLREQQDLESSGPSEIWSKHVIFKTFVLISLSEMGDKTQLLAVSLSTVDSPTLVFWGASLALITTSALGVIAGKKILSSRNLVLIHRIGALLFFAFALVAAYQGVRAL